MSETRDEKQRRVLKNLLPGFGFPDVILVIIFFGYAIFATMSRAFERGKTVPPDRVAIGSIALLVMLFAFAAVYRTNVSLVHGVPDNPDGQRRANLFRAWVAMLMLVCPIVQAVFVGVRGWALLPLWWFIGANVLVAVVRGALKRER